MHAKPLRHLDMQVHAPMQGVDRSFHLPHAQAECSSPSLAANGADLTRPGWLHEADLCLNEAIHALAALLRCLTYSRPAPEVPGCGRRWKSRPALPSDFLDSQNEAIPPTALSLRLVFSDIL
jgi:hypothetical protein